MGMTDGEIRLHSEHVVITGAAGFVGTHLARAASRVCEHLELVDVDDRLNRLEASGLLDASNLSFTRHRLDGTLFDPGSDADLVIHLAALPHVEFSVYRPAEVMRNNIDALISVLEGCRARDIPLLFASSVEVYGGFKPNADELFVENDALVPASPYSASKIAGEALVAAYRQAYGLSASIVRLTNLYGPWQAPDRLVPRLITQMLAGVGWELDPGRLRDLVHVSDAVEGILCLVGSPVWGSTTNLASGVACSSGEVASILQSMHDVTPEVTMRSRSGDGRGQALICSGERLEQLTGWRPKTDLLDGLSTTLDWYRRNQAWWSPYLDEIASTLGSIEYIVDSGTWPMAGVR